VVSAKAWDSFYYWLRIVYHTGNVCKAYPLFAKYQAVGWNQLGLFDAGLLVLGGVSVLLLLIFLYEALESLSKQHTVADTIPGPVKA
jgi:hypothetical protein